MVWPRWLKPPIAPVARRRAVAEASTSCGASRGCGGQWSRCQVRKEDCAWIGATAPAVAMTPRGPQAPSDVAMRGCGAVAAPTAAHAPTATSPPSTKEGLLVPRYAQSSIEVILEAIPSVSSSNLISVNSPAHPNVSTPWLIGRLMALRGQPRGCGRSCPSKPGRWYS